MSATIHHTDKPAEEDSKPAAIALPITQQQQPQTDTDDDIEVWTDPGPSHKDVTPATSTTFDSPTVMRVVHSTDLDDIYLFNINDRALLVHDATIPSPPYSKRDFTGTVINVDRKHMTVQLEFGTTMGINGAALSARRISMKS
jgi:hypothetical protein